MTKELLIITLIVVAIYLYYQQNNQPNLNLQPNSTAIQDLKNQVQHYQTLYQKRVAKDLEVDQSTQIQQLTTKNNLYQQKVGALETSLLNLAKNKLKGKKESSELLNHLESHWNQDKELWKSTETNYSKQLTQVKQDQQQKEQTIIGLNQSYEKLTNKIKQNNQNLLTKLDKYLAKL